MAFTALGLVLVACSVWGFWLEPSSLRVTHERIEIGAELSAPLRIAVLTDLHVGSPFNGLAKLHEIVERTNAEHPDLICILGDLVVTRVLGGSAVAPEPIAEELAHLRAASGVFAVLGNHDGWLDHARVRAALVADGIQLVEDTAVRVATGAGPVWVAGVSDLWTGHPDVTVALHDVPADNVPVLLLSHNPDIFPRVTDRVTLTLAGHTHGGQVRLPIIGTPVVPSQYGSRYAAGLIEEHGMRMYVATGIGTSILPVRFRVPPTIPILELVH